VRAVEAQPVVLLCPSLLQPTSMLIISDTLTKLKPTDRFFAPPSSSLCVPLSLSHETAFRRSTRRRCPRAGLHRERLVEQDQLDSNVMSFFESSGE